MTSGTTAKSKTIRSEVASVNARDVPVDFNKIVKVKKTGEGTYGIVYTAQSIPPGGTARSRNQNGAKIAVKRNLVEKTTDFTVSLKELHILNIFRGHPNIVNLLAVSFGDPFSGGGGRMSPLRQREYKDDKVHFLFEHALYDVHTLLYQTHTPMVTLKVAMVQMLLAIEFIHAKGIIHRDIKPSNVLVFNQQDGSVVFKLCDFGLSKPFTRQGNQSPRTVTPWYRAPEICLDWPDYTMKSDIWSIGCTFYELLTKKPLLYDVSEKDGRLINAILGLLPEPVHPDILDKMFKVRKVPLTAIASPARRKTWSERIGFDTSKVRSFNSSGPGTYDECLNLLSHLLQFNPDDRWSATQALEHPFFTGYRDYIKAVREACPPVSVTPPILDVVDCLERKWMTHVAFTIFNNRNAIQWYQHRILFQAIDLFDRYLYWATQRAKDGDTRFVLNPRESEDRGVLHSRYETELRFTVCLYISIKYFTTLSIPVSYHDLAMEPYRTPDALLVAEQFELTLIRDALQFGIYRDTVYEIADKYGDILDDKSIRDILMIHGMTTSFNGMTPQELYELYKQALAN